MDRLEVGVLHAIYTADLASDELRVQAQIDMGGAETARLLQCKAHRRPLGDVVRRVSEPFGDLGQDGAVGSVTQDRAGTRRPGVAARGAIGMDEEPQRIPAS